MTEDKQDLDVYLRIRLRGFARSTEKERLEAVLSHTSQWVNPEDEIEVLRIEPVEPQP